MFYICRSSELWWYWSLDVATVLGWFWWILWQHWPSCVSLCWAATWGSSPSIHHLIVWYQSQSDWKASVLARQVNLMPLSSVQPGLIFSLDWYPFLKVFSSTLSFLESYMTRGAFLDRSPDNFSSMKSCFVFVGFTFKMKVSIILKMIKSKQVNEAKLTGLWARKCANIQQVLISKFPFGPRTACYCPHRSMSLLQLVMSSFSKKVLLSVHARTSEANILHLDQMIMKSMTCKWLFGTL